MGGAYTMDNFVCLFKKEIARRNYLQSEHLHFGKVERRVSSDRVKKLKGKHCTIKLMMPFLLQIIFKEEF